MITELIDAIVTRLATDMPGLGTCAAYPKIEKRVTLPAVLIDLESLDPEDLDHDQFNCMARFSAYCIVAPEVADAYLVVRNLAATVAVRIQQEEDFGFDVTHRAAVLSVGEDNFKPELDGYMVWAVEFEVGISIGEDQWLIDPGVGVPVTQITLGDFNSMNIQNVVAADAPVNEVEISLPDQPKG